jgi:CDP-paratose 2-epimerase
MRILITGGAGFVGSHLASSWAALPGHEVVVLDNLRRRGSELNLPFLRRRGVSFVHGDVRKPGDLDEVGGQFDLVVDASAEPSVLAGTNGSPEYVIETNLYGTVNVLNFARKRAGRFLFLSTSRVYSIAALKALPLHQVGRRYALSGQGPGWTSKGIGEAFSTSSARSFYGASKLASELLLQEYVESYGLKGLVNRCGVIAGPGQFGKADQGVFTLWIANHYFGRPLAYTGFGGQGFQVRDLLHPQDLFDLLQRQLSQENVWDGRIYNVGGGERVSTSLAEWTEEAKLATGKELSVESKADSASVDIPYYVTDHSLVTKDFGWSPSRDRRRIASDIAQWIKNEEALLAPLFAP